MGAFLRLVYSGPVPSKPIMDLSLNEVRVGFMDLVLDAAAGLERRSPRNFIQGVKYRRFRKFFDYTHTNRAQVLKHNFSIG